MFRFYHPASSASGKILFDKLANGGEWGAHVARVTYLLAMGHTVHSNRSHTAKCSMKD
jgi:hypothetical protein